MFEHFKKIEISGMTEMNQPEKSASRDRQGGWWWPAENRS
jgi:hypothetical protein